jgi:PHS family inorganic phosphate transporter-like MFS transporter
MIIIVATFGQAISGGGPVVSVIGAIITWRFILGIGIGGDYPLSAVISSEFAATRSRGRLMTAVFAFQGWGNFSASLFYISTLLYLRREISSCCPRLAYCRLCVQEPNHQ